MVNKHGAVRKSGYIFEYRLAFLGGSKSGKTSVLNRFISDTFTHRYRPTVEDHVTHIIDHKGNMCVCLMVDTSGSGDFPAMRRLAITKGNAFLLFYSINDRKTFEIAKNTVREIKSLKNPAEDVKIIVVGNKTDLENERQVKRQEGEEFVDSINRDNVSSLFFECSAKNNQNIDLVFTSLLNMFIPEEAEQEVIPERSTFTRMSLRKKANKHRLQKQNALDILTQNANFHSDTDLTRRNKYHTRENNQNPGLLLRASSLTSGIATSDSDSAGEDLASENQATKKRKGKVGKQNDFKRNVLMKTFGSVQKLLKSDFELRRASTMDNSFSRKQTLI